MNIHFPRRPLRIILTFTVTAISATFAWRHFDFRHPGENSIFPFFCFSIACCCARECLRYARYLIHPETLRLDSDGIHIRHNDAAAWQVLHLPWAAICDAWCDGNGRLQLVWLKAGKAHHLALRLDGAQTTTASGRICRGQPVIDALLQRLRDRLPPPMPWPSAPVAIIPRQWSFRQREHRTLRDFYYSDAFLPLLAIATLIAALTLAAGEHAQPLAAVLVFVPVGFAMLDKFSGRGDNYTPAPPPPPPFLRMDSDGVHCQSDGMRAAICIPWQAIDDVAADSWQEDSGDSKYWRHTLNLSWRPHMNAPYLRHIRYNTGAPADEDADATALTATIAASIRAHCPNLGQCETLPRAFIRIPGDCSNRKNPV